MPEVAELDPEATRPPITVADTSLGSESARPRIKWASGGGKAAEIRKGFMGEVTWDYSSKPLFGLQMMPYL